MIADTSYMDTSSYMDRIPRMRTMLISMVFHIGDNVLAWLQDLLTIEASNLRGAQQSEVLNDQEYLPKHDPDHPP